MQQQPVRVLGERLAAEIEEHTIGVLRIGIRRDTIERVVRRMEELFHAFATTGVNISLSAAPSVPPPLPPHLSQVARSS